MTVKPKYYPSSAAFATGFLVHTTYNSGCLRKIYLADQGLREKLKQDVSRVGADNEDAFEKSLIESGLKYSRESAVKSDTGAVLFSGRTDFQTVDEIIELKSTRSKNKRTALRAGRIPVENVAQIVAYMLETEKPKGRLIFTYYDEEKKLKEDYEFPIRIENDGSIWISDREYRFNVYDQLHHRVLLALLYTDRSCTSPTFSRPVGYDRQFDSPCTFCPFKIACDQLDKGSVNTLEEFVIESTMALAAKG